jgi:hypothetical protein
MIKYEPDLKITSNHPPAPEQGLGEARLRRRGRGY